MVTMSKPKSALTGKDDTLTSLLNNDQHDMLMIKTLTTFESTISFTLFFLFCFLETCLDINKFCILSRPTFDLRGGIFFRTDTAALACCEDCYRRKEPIGYVLLQKQ